jgi:hypothetical protein
VACEFCSQAILLPLEVTWCPRRDSNPEPTDYQTA